MVKPKPATALDQIRRLNTELAELRARATALRTAYDSQCKLVLALYEPTTKPAPVPWQDACAVASHLWAELDECLTEIYRVKMAHTAKVNRRQMRHHRIQSRRT